MKISSRRWSQKKTQRLIASLIGGSLCIFLLMNYITRGSSVVTILFPDINDNYMDFFNSLIDASCANPYTERHVIYPPLCYVLYGVFGHLIPLDYYSSGSFYIRGTMEGMLSFGCYMGISLFALCFFTIQYAKMKRVHTPWFAYALLLSAPVLFSIQRGNFIVFTVACIMAFFCYKDDESFIKRQFGFLMLAVAANIKIYPALFGLLLVSKRKWRDCLCCITYGIVLFCVPMLRFGGLSNILVLIGNIMNTTSNFSVRLGTRVDLDCLFSFLSAKGILSNLFSALRGKTLIWGSALMLLCFFCLDEEWKQLMCLTLICTFIPGFSYMYNLMYLIPLMIEAVRQDKRLVSFLVLLPFMYYPFDISSVSWIRVESATLLPRLWDIIAMLSGAGLVGATLIDAAKVVVMRGMSRERIWFNGGRGKQIIFNPRPSK